MKSIIIAGKKGVGKSTLADIIIGDKRVFNVDSGIINSLEIRLISQFTKVILFDGIVSKKDIESWKNLISKKTITIRKPYQKELIEIDTRDILAIGIVQDEDFPLEISENCQVFILK